MTTRYGSGPQQDNSYCGYVVGQHVVYVGKPTAYSPMRQKWDRAGLIRPKTGVVYTIRSVFIGFASGQRRVSLLLQEIHNPEVSTVDGLREPGFVASKFRPLQKLTPEMFMSTDAPVKQGAPA